MFWFESLKEKISKVSISIESITKFDFYWNSYHFWFSWFSLSRLDFNLNWKEWTFLKETSIASKLAISVLQYGILWWTQFKCFQFSHYCYCPTVIFDWSWFYQGNSGFVKIMFCRTSSKGFWCLTHPQTPVIFWLQISWVFAKTQHFIRSWTISVF